MLREAPTMYEEAKDWHLVQWKRVRLAMEHENTLITARMTWLLSAQGFLLGAFMLVFAETTKKAFDEGKFYESAIVLYALVFAGMLISLFLSRGIRAAHDQHDRLRVWWYEQVVEQSDRGHPPICGFEPVVKRFRIHYHHFPMFFVPIWLILSSIPLNRQYTSWKSFLEPYVLQYGWFVGLMLFVGVFSYWAGSKTRK